NQTPEGYQTSNGRSPIKRPKGIKPQMGEAQSNARRASNLKWAKPNQTPEGHQTSNGQSPIKRPKVIKPQMGEAQSNARRASNLKWAKPNQTHEGHQTSCGRSPIKRPKGINPHVGCAHMSHLPLLITASRCSINSVSLSKYSPRALLPSPGPPTPQYSNCSMVRPARLYPSLSFRWSIEVLPLLLRTTSLPASVNNSSRSDTRISPRESPPSSLVSWYLGK